MEQAFQEVKSGLDLRPVQHWPPERINGHVVFCFLALVLGMTLRRKLNKMVKEFRYQDLLLHFSELKAVELDLGGRRYLAHRPGVGRSSFKSLHLRPSQHVIGLLYPPL